MVLQNSGTAIKASQINVELGRVSNTKFQLGASTERGLAGVASGRIRFGNFYGKSNIVDFAGSGSLSFAASSSTNQYLSVPASADFAMGTGDFTVEWWQYQIDTALYPRVFTVGTASGGNAFGVSIESGSFYLWLGGVANLIQTMTNYKNKWVHFAVSRNSSVVRVFRDGTQIGNNLNNSTNLNNTSNPLVLGSEGAGAITGTYFKGKLSNFHMVKGTGKYTANFSRPVNDLTADANSKILLLAATSGTYLDDSSGTGKVVSNVGSVVWSAI